jgi:hypothetical protein
VIGEPQRLGVLGDIPNRCIRKPIGVSCSDFHCDLDLGAEQSGQMRNHFLRDAPKVAVQALRVESDDPVEAAGSRRRAWSACVLVVQPITGLLALAGFVSG